MPKYLLTWRKSRFSGTEPSKMTLGFYARGLKTSSYQAIKVQLKYKFSDHWNRTPVKSMTEIFQALLINRSEWRLPGTGID